MLPRFNRNRFLGPLTKGIVALLPGGDKQCIVIRAWRIVLKQTLGMVMIDRVNKSK
jgi:hypothetical protein